MLRTLSLFLLISTSVSSQVNLNQGLMAYYPFSGDANDASGNNNNPVFNNATLTNDRFGTPNSAYHFNGTSSYMKIPNSATLGTGNLISLCAWVRPMGFSYGTCHGSSLIDKGTTDFLPGNYFMRYSDAAFTNFQHCSIPIPDIAHEDFLANNAVGPPGGYTPFIQLNTWYCLVYTYDGTTEKLYVNCELKVTKQTSGLNFTNSTDLYFGRFFNASYPYWLEGDLDEVRIYNRPLNPQEVGVLAQGNLNFDFSYQQNTCNPLSVQFTAACTDNQNPYWSFGDGNTSTGITNPAHTYLSTGNYIVKYSVGSGVCSDTITKTISISVINEDIIATHDTTICAGASKQLLTVPALGFCWSPTTYLNNPNSPNPVTSPQQNITYYYTAEITGSNLIVNGDFNNGNSGFTSEYIYANPNITEGQYFVGPSPQAWNAALSNCTDHTGGNGNMMLVNGASIADVKVWTESITVIPNTNYSFSTWVQALYPPNPAQLQFSINNHDIGNLITASLPPCTWSQFYTSWNSGNNTIANISIVNKNTQVQGNDFALDDISFAPVQLKQDSVKITVDVPVVTATNNTAVCEGIPVQLNVTGAATYIWTPATGLNNATIANPVATPATSTQYIVTGTTLNGCQAKDTVDITVLPKPVITKSNDVTICTGSSAQLSANGGVTYNWSPAATLNNPSIPNPVASPVASTTYYVTVSGANSCNNTDSIKVTVRSTTAFTINSPVNICTNKSVQLNASGGDLYAWQPAGSLDNPASSNPNASPSTTTTYTVQITDIQCGNTSSLSTIVTVMPLPVVHAGKSNDIDCSSSQSHLTASGALQYSWSPAGSLVNPNSANPIATPIITTLYTVNGNDLNGCTNHDTVSVKVSATNAGGYLMATAFTPNNDGLNDCYGIKFWGTILELDFSIYNRWGERVFHTSNPADCWNGVYKGIPQDPAIFIYVIKAATTCQGSVFRKGTFALIR